MTLLAALRTNRDFRTAQLASIDGGKIRTWGETADRVGRAAAGWISLGLKPGERVGILANNSAAYFEVELSIWWAGGAVVPMNTRFSHDETLYSIADSGMRFLVCDEAFREQAERAVAAEPDLGLVPIKSDASTISFEELASASAPVPAVSEDETALAGIFYTGGTTGFPKGVMLSHRSLIASALGLQPASRYTEESRVLHAAPMFHLADATSGHAAMLAGACNVYVPRFVAGQVIDTIEQHGVTDAMLVPTMIGMIVNDPDYRPDRVGSLCTLMFGASPTSESLLAKVRSDLPDLRLVHVYGQSEMGPLISFLEPRHQVPGSPRALSIGRPFPSVEVRIADEAGNDVAEGEPGEILARGPTMMDGYWNKSEQTAATLVDGWIKTGDVAYRDAEGFMFICDRAKDMIITGGENVFSAEVENVIAGHPAVAGAAVIGIPDEEFGERVHAVLVLREGTALTLDELFTFCRERLANYKCPRSLEVIDALPLAATGKVLKRDLREPYWKGRKRGVN